MSDWDEAMHANILRAAIRVGNLTSRSAVGEVGGWLVVDAGVDMVRFNQAWVAGGAEEALRGIDDALGWFHDRGAEPSFRLRTPQDDSISVALCERGCRLVHSEPAMLLDRLDGVDPSRDVSIARVRTPDDVRRYGEVDGPAWHEITQGIARTAAAFPDFALFLHEADGEPCATSMAVAHRGIVGVYNVQVRPAFRRRGLGRAMTAAAVAYGREQGCRAAVLQSTEMGFPVYRSMGFETRYSVNQYTPGDNPD